MFQVGPFHFTEPIGRGGMGVVWLGAHADGLAVAAKVLSGRGARDPAFVRAFRTEVRAVAGLRHPRVVTVLDYGVLGQTDEGEGAPVPGSPYLVMELLDQGTLAQQLGRLGWKRLKGVLLDLLDALAHAHARGIVHRDLKPGNVMLAPGADPGGPPSVRLVDFGLAHLGGAEAGGPSSSGGTPPFMAPEQYEDAWRDYGPWTDLYALGCTAWALVTGSPPFRRRTFAGMLAAHALDAPPPLGAPSPVPAGLEAWLRTLLEKDPADRYPDAASAAWDLLALEAPDTPAPPSAPLTHTAGTDTVLRPAPPHRTTILWDTAAIRRAATPAGPRWGRRPTRPRPPVPVDWRRREPPQPSPRLVGAGLGLFGLRPVPLVDREGERDTLWRLLREAVDAGEPRAVVLRGAAGVGKSRLSAWVCERAQEVGAAGAIRVTHEPVPGPSDGLAAAVRRAFRCEGLPRAEAVARVGGVLRSRGEADPYVSNGLVELFAPATDADLAGGAVPVRLAGTSERHALLRRWLTGLGCSVLWLDDVQWGADALAFARRLVADGGPSVLMVLTARDEALAERPEEAARLAAVEALPGAHVVEVGPLPPEARHALVRGLLGLEGRLAEQLEERTAGNPLFAVQLVSDWVGRGILVPDTGGFRLASGAEATLPDDIAEVWRTRIARVLRGRPPADAAALEIAAVLGQDVDRAEWQQACRTAGLRADDALIEALLVRRLALTRSPEAFSFVHGMLRESLELRARDGDRLTTHHSACADALRTVHADPDPERLARHLVGSDRLEEALTPLLRAARIRQGLGHLGLARAHVDHRDALLDRLGVPELAAARFENAYMHTKQLTMTGRLPEALELATQTLEKARASGDVDQLAPALLTLARSHYNIDRIEDAERHLDEVLPLLEGRAPAPMLATLYSTCWDVAVSRNDFETAAAWADRLVEVLGDSTWAKDRGNVHAVRGITARYLGDHPTARSHLEKAHAAYTEGGMRWMIAASHADLADLAVAEGDVDAAIASYRAAIELNEAIGSGEEGFPRYLLGRLLADREQWTEARTQIAGSLAQLARQGRDLKVLQAHVDLLEIAVELDDDALWEDHLGSARNELPARAFARPSTVEVARRAAARALDRGRSNRACALLGIARQQATAIGDAEALDAIEAALAAVPCPDVPPGTDAGAPAP